MKLTEKQIDNLYRCRLTIEEMLVDRGYLISPSSQQEFNNWCVNSDSYDDFSMRVNATENKDELLIVFTDISKVGVKSIKNLIHKIESEQIFHMILILKDSITTFGKNALSDIQNNDSYDSRLVVELFQEQELLINITKHRLTPRHRALSETEKTDLLSEHNMKPTQLPRILRNDPVCRYYNLGKGDIVEITRKDNDSLSVCYRLVV